MTSNLRSHPDHHPACDCKGCLKDEILRLNLELDEMHRAAYETSVLLPGEDIAEALERRGDALSIRAARHIRIKWNTEEGLRQQLRRETERLNAIPESSGKTPATREQIETLVREFNESQEPKPFDVKTPERRLTASEERSFTETSRRSPRRIDPDTGARTDNPPEPPDADPIF